MNWQPIRKPQVSGKDAPNLSDYARIAAGFSWEKARHELEGLPDDKGLNIAHEAVDRHANGSRAGHIAWRWLSKSGAVQDFTFAAVRDATNR